VACTKPLFRKELFKRVRRYEVDGAKRSESTPSNFGGFAHLLIIVKAC
jgi:hypothetical protein